MPSARSTLIALAACATLAGVAFAIVERNDGKATAPTYPAVDRASAERAAERPNIVFIYTDDQNYDDLNRRFMPKTTRLLGDRGTSFSNFVVATPVCCPSRATTLTGAYPHNTGVYSNKNGWDRLEDEQNNLGSWMQRAGYRTAWLGKFLQGYEAAVGDPAIPAPGFDDWLVTVQPKFFGYKLYTDQPPGVIKGGDGRADYYTDRLTKEAVRLIARQSKAKRPLFLVLNHLAPHRGEGGRGRCKGSVAPAARDFGRFAGEPLPLPPSFNRVADASENGFAGKRLKAGEIDKLRAKFRCRAESLTAVDRSVAKVHRAVARTGELDNTVFVFTSDNGILLGEHGLTGKSVPYEEATRMPLLISAPERLLGGAPAPQTAALAANVDLAPTLLELAGADPCFADGRCRTLDGRSLVPLLQGRADAWPRDRAILIEGGDHGEPCSYRGLRLEREVVITHVEPGPGGSCAPTGAPERYDLSADPFQLRNLAASGDRADLRTDELFERMSRLQHCAGTETERAGSRPRPACD